MKRHDRVYILQFNKIEGKRKFDNEKVLKNFIDIVCTCFVNIKFNLSIDCMRVRLDKVNNLYNKRVSIAITAIFLL
jgi:hypothetical protein